MKPKIAKRKGWWMCGSDIKGWYFSPYLNNWRDAWVCYQLGVEK